MADCSASGTAIDRVIQTAVVSALNQAGNNGASSSAAAASAATQAFGNWALGGVGNNGRMMGGSVAGQQVMPLTPLETIGGGSVSMHQQQGIISGGDAARLDEAWVAAAAPASSAQHAPVNHHMVHSHHYQQQQHMRLQHHHAAAPQMMMQQQQQQMMMMQQMQLQQQQMAAMVQYQQQQQNQKKAMEAQQHAAEHRSSADGTTGYDTAASVDDEVATVSEEEQLNHEGITEDASVERLAQAWRDAEAEYAEEFGEDEYDVSDMGGMYSEGYQTATADNTAMNNTAEPHYEFSEASRTHGCLQTPTADGVLPSVDYPADLYERGLQRFTEGDLRTAILCFESTLQNLDPEHADAWRMLGKCHTENDEDRKAIACWVRSLERDPFSPETQLLMAVAYVNELDHERALATLRGWVAHHPLYAGMADGLDGGHGAEEEDLYGSGDVEEVEGGGIGVHRMRTQTRAEMREVERLLLRALEYDATADAAADVYEALGVVYNVSQDYDAAVSTFRRAIEVRPDDYQLRNKLGATLANSNRSEEALPSYGAALRLKPKYARGFLNMAIAHSNLHNYGEAARCYLQTLSLNPEARHVWSYLRIALTCEERWDLLPMAAEQNLGGFQEHFDFVEY